MLCCAVLFCSVLCFSVLFYSVLCYVFLCCSVLCCGVFLCCSVLCFSALCCAVLCFSALCCAVLCWQGLPRSSRQLWHLPAGSGWKQGAAHLVVQRSPSAQTGCASSGFYTWPSHCACSCLEETAGGSISFIPVLSLASHLSLQARIPVVGRRPILCASDAATPTKTQQFFTWRPKIQLLPDKAFLS